MLIWFSPKALHVGIIAYDSVPGSVRATVADRDNIGNDDWVRVYLDTFNDRRRAFIFGVNPLGVQEDGVQTEGGFSAGMTRGGMGGGVYGGNCMSGQVDLSPDYQFDSKGRRHRRRLRRRDPDPVQEPALPGQRPAALGHQHRAQDAAHRPAGHVDRREARGELPRRRRGTMEGLHDLQRGVVTELQPFVDGLVDGARGRRRRATPTGRTDLEPGRQPALRASPTCRSTRR